MADTYVQGCFAFACSPAEMALLEEAFQASYDLGEDYNPDTVDPSPEFLALFPAAEDDRWAGFRDIFSDHDFPTFGATLTGSNLADPSVVVAVITSEIALEPEPLAKLIQRCCSASLQDGPIGFEWSVACSRMRVGEFGGGWCAIFPDRIEIETTGEALSAALSSGIL